MLECVVNISEGTDLAVVQRLADACGESLLDVHTDPAHNRSVFTMAGPFVEEAVRNLSLAALDNIDISSHSGAHPRLGAVDVVPFVPLGDSTWQSALRARDEYALWWATNGVPCFLYGGDRTLPEIRKHAFVELVPDHGPPAPHARAGATAVGVRNVLVAYNLWLAGTDASTARAIARSLRGPSVRSLALNLHGRWQISCNLISPLETGPAAVYDSVARHARIEHAELVGLITQEVLRAQPPPRWEELDLSPAKTIEARLETRDGLRSGED